MILNQFQLQDSNEFARDLRVAIDNILAVDGHQVPGCLLVVEDQNICFIIAIVVQLKHM